VDHHQDLIVLMCGTRAPVEGPCDHGVAIDDGELIWLRSQIPLPAWVLRDAVGC
jgi:hypothetical protein